MIKPDYKSAILLLFIITTLISSDNSLHLVHADKTIGKMKNNERVHLWSGNVKAYQDTVTMYCDSAIFYENQDIANFIGNVLIDDRHHKLWANKIEYQTANKIAICTGNVRISGENDSLYSDLFIYNFKTKSANGNGNVFLWDKKDGSRIWGDNGIYLKSLQESHISGNARLEKPNESKKDTLKITSKKMDYFGGDPKHAIAIDSVYIFQNNLRATCDSAVYNVAEDIVHLRINPLVWQNNSKMSGLNIDLAMDSLKLKEIIVSGNAKIETLADTLEDKYDILEGKSIQVLIENDQPEKVIARQNAKSIYMVKENEKKQGINAASSDSIIIFFNVGVMDSIIIAGGTEGTFYPPDHKGEIKSEH